MRIGEDDERQITYLQTEADDVKVRNISGEEFKHLAGVQRIMI